MVITPPALASSLTFPGQLYFISLSRVLLLNFRLNFSYLKAYSFKKCSASKIISDANFRAVKNLTLFFTLISFTGPYYIGFFSSRCPEVEVNFTMIFEWLENNTASVFDFKCGFNFNTAVEIIQRPRQPAVSGTYTIGL